MIKATGVKSALLTLAVGLPAVSVQAQDLNVLLNGAIEAEHCAYGRGASAIEQAKTEALAEIARAVQSGKVLSIANTYEQMDTASSTWLQQLSDMAQAGYDMRGLRTNTSKPRLEGSDTCVTVSLNKQPLGTASTDSGSWDDAQTTVSVTVVGEGWRDDKQGMSAREVAELDALRRAISQVVGVWLTEQRTQYSNTVSHTNNTSDNFAMNDFVARQLQTKSAGMVKQWQLIDSKQLANNGIEVTIRADVEKQKVELATSHIMQQIGSPRVAVEAPAPLDSELKRWLSQQGVELSDNANLILRAKPRLIERAGTARLDLRVQVTDQAGNVYGEWQNDPALLSLPNGPNALYDLIDVHLALEPQQQALSKQLGDAFMRVVQEGGLVHDVYINSRYLAQPERLSGVLSTLGGAQDVSISNNGEFYKAQLRFSGKTGDLVAALQQSLQPITATELPKAVIANEFTIRFN
tara:strand:+ start:4597 stop:5991 length:1395 start_codon:yes stop_codon:yes gene_type:complete